MSPLWIYRVDFGDYYVAYEFYEDGVKYVDSLEGIVEFAPLDF